MIAFASSALFNEGKRHSHPPGNGEVAPSRVRACGGRLILVGGFACPPRRIWAVTPLRIYCRGGCLCFESESRSRQQIAIKRPLEVSVVFDSARDRCGAYTRPGACRNGAGAIDWWVAACTSCPALRRHPCTCCLLYRRTRTAKPAMASMAARLAPAQQTTRLAHSIPAARSCCGVECYSGRILANIGIDKDYAVVRECSAKVIQVGPFRYRERCPGIVQR